MEFYRIGNKISSLRNSFNSQRDGILLFGSSAKSSDQNCFNSQRDGILRYLVFNFDSVFDVLIPNEMEFYTPVSCVGFVLDGFNSQRDGILHEKDNFSTGSVVF